MHAVPALAETAFLQASFKQAEDAPLLPGRVSIYRDGVFVGRSPMALAAKDEAVRLGFGADEKVKIARTVVRRNEGIGRPDRDVVQDRRARVQDHHPQRPRFPDPGCDRGSDCRSARTRTSRSRCCPSTHAADRDAICATAAA